MLVKRKIAVKVIVTEEYKQRVAGQLEDALRKVELAQQQMEVQGRRYLAEIENTDSAKASALRRRLERQRKRQGEIKARLSDRLATVRGLEPGAEHLHGVLDGFVGIQVGHKLSQKPEADEIVVKDDVVVEIRHA